MINNFKINKLFAKSNLFKQLDINTLRERYGLPNSEDYIETIYSSSDFDVNSVCQ